MSEAHKKIALAIALVVLALLILLPGICYKVGWKRGYAKGIESAATQPRDTIWKHDTTFFFTPVPDPVFIELPPEEIPIIDSGITIEKDTLIVPRIQRHYQDTTYEAWVSGYNPRLDSIKVFQRTAMVQVPVEKKIKTRWGIGIQAGYGASKDGLSPYVGVGISYNLLSF